MCQRAHGHHLGWWQRLGASSEALANGSMTAPTGLSLLATRTAMSSRRSRPAACASTHTRAQTRCALSGPVATSQRRGHTHQPIDIIDTAQIRGRAISAIAIGRGVAAMAVALAGGADVGGYDPGGANVVALISCGRLFFDLSNGEATGAALALSLALSRGKSGATAIRWPKARHVRQHAGRTTRALRRGGYTNLHQTLRRVQHHLVRADTLRIQAMRSQLFLYQRSIKE